MCVWASIHFFNVLRPVKLHQMTANHNAVAEKARVLESHGAKGGIVLDNNPDSSSQGSNIFAMSGDGTDDVS